MHFQNLACPTRVQRRPLLLARLSNARRVRPTQALQQCRPAQST